MTKKAESKQAPSGEELVRQAAFKVQVLGAEIGEPASSQDEQQDVLSGMIGGANRIVDPPYAPKTLLRIWENSGALNQNVESYMTNIDGLGYHLAPIYEFDSAEVHEHVRGAMWAELDAESDKEVPLPTDEEVQTMLDKLRRRARLEKVRLETFLSNVNPDGSFVSLRRITRQHLEILGNAYWEVLRDKTGRPARFVHVPATSVRLTPLDDTPTTVQDRVSTGLLSFTEVTQYRFFRRYVQQAGKQTIWFKEYGDPRVVSRLSGKVYKDQADFDRNKGQRRDKPATELLHFKLPRPGEAYGVPRWIGNLLAVLGSRAADEVNYDYFDNKAIPPLAILVSGGRLGSDSIARLETYIRDNLKGRRNFHKILIVEAQQPDAAQMAGDTTIPKIAIERLSEQQTGDALFQKYDERNIDKIGSSFRLPRLMRGDVRDFNRATAVASMRFAEEQVFEPERQEFDAMFNRRVLPALDVSLWRFVSNSHRTRDPDSISVIVSDLVRRGVLTPNEGRSLMSDALGRIYDPIQEFWAKQPLMITMAGFRPGFDPMTAQPGTEQPGTTHTGKPIAPGETHVPPPGGIKPTRPGRTGGEQAARSGDTTGDVGRDLTLRDVSTTAVRLAMMQQELLELITELSRDDDNDAARRAVEGDEDGESVPKTV